MYSFLVFVLDVLGIPLSHCFSLAFWPGSTHGWRPLVGGFGLVSQWLVVALLMLGDDCPVLKQQQNIAWLDIAMPLNMEGELLPSLALTMISLYSLLFTKNNVIVCNERLFTPCLVSTN